MKLVLSVAGFLAILLMLTFVQGPASADGCQNACQSEDVECIQGCQTPKSATKTEPFEKAALGNVKEKDQIACTQTPTSCSQNSDCSCSGCCGSLAGVGVCQPSC